MVPSGMLTIPSLHDVRIREARGEPIGFVADRRPEEEGADALEIEEPHRKEACASAVESLLAETAWHDVAVVVEHAERVGMLQHPRTIVAGDGRREDVVNVGDHAAIRRCCWSMARR